ncbi:TetR-like C-terminal domain-containing protein [Lactobacillus sp. ESL0681]|uniref:TetR-like C-terminal domain-containing protein n=1 Tax=Lactobacillus sp. ESL0681 TaxID=2983211 RepID=UPI0023F73F0A|nr:TetR-like C-terminal domain-containing protein [Lactobacillus sp. ESL0681]WEV39869.1 TetR-like C-terminal domain-containing protein [Lactobacillus sp. ESL0681]
MKNTEISLQTKRDFSGALKQLLKKELLNKITVRELLEVANKTRPTFYYHFEDVQDLIKWTVQDEIIALLNESKGYKKWDEDLYKVLTYFQNNQLLGRAFYDSLDIYQFNLFFRKPQINVLLGYIDEIIKKYHLQVRADDRLFIAEMFTGGFTEIIFDWLGNGQKETPDEIRQRLCRTQQDIIVYSLKVADKNKNLFC